MTRWKVGLSDGSVCTEGISPFNFVKGNLSPWLKLIESLKKNNLHITSLSITDGQKTFNLPSAGNNPKFAAFYNAEKPIGFNFHRAYGMDNNGENKDVFALATAIYETYELQLWVDENNTNNSWVLVRERDAGR